MHLVEEMLLKIDFIFSVQKMFLFAFEVKCNPLIRTHLNLLKICE